jgi:hypothetical protein
VKTLRRNGNEHSRCAIRVVHRGAFNEADLDQSLVDGAEGLAGVGNGQSDVDAGIAAAERHQMPRQPIAGNGLACGQVQNAVLELPSSARASSAASALASTAFAS